MTSFKIISALQKYYQQQDRAKISSKINKSLGKVVPSQDKVSLSQEAKRLELISNLTKDIINNLLVGREQKPTIINEIQEELEKEVGEKLFFAFDPKEKTVTVRREGNKEFSSAEAEAIIERLWEITYKKVKSLI